MDTSNEVAATDTLGRRVAPRRYRTTEEKRRIVEETLVRGASVAVVARKHEVNANLVFGWRKLYQQGLLETEPQVAAVPLLPIQLAEDSLSNQRATVRAARNDAKPSCSTWDQGGIEIELISGERVRVHGEAARELLKQLIDALCRR